MDRIVPISYDFHSEDEIRCFVEECEANFYRQVDEAADSVLAGGKKFIALSGPTCSGKTTASDRICNEFSSRGIRVKVVSLDDFYFDRELLEERAQKSGTAIDFDSPTTINTAFLADCVRKLRLGKVADLPHYSFVKGRCDGTTPFCGADADIFLFEGIQAIYPNVLDILGAEGVISLFIRPSSSIEAGGEIFESHELRFARRLVRDFRYRNAPPEYTFYLWEGVRANEKKHIEPYENSVDFHIDSTMAYEPAIIRDLYIDYLSRVPAESQYKAKAMTLVREYDRIPSISSKFVPKNSIFREFIGQEED